MNTSDSIFLKLVSQGNFAQLGKSIRDEAVRGAPFIYSMALVIAGANRSEDSLPIPAKMLRRGAETIIEALTQRGATKELLRVAASAWQPEGSSPFSVKCIESAIDVGPLSTVMDEAESLWLVDPTPNDPSPRADACAAAILLRLLQAGYKDAELYAGEAFLLGRGVPKDPERALKLVRTAARRSQNKAWDLLLDVTRAFDVLGEITKKYRPDSGWPEYCQNQMRVAKDAADRLKAFWPGQELDCLAEEWQEMEYKREAKNDLVDVLQEVAAFLNSPGGGVLLIGVEDDRKAYGLQASFANLAVPNADKFQLTLMDKFKASLEGLYLHDIKIDFPSLHDKQICRVKVAFSKKPVHLKHGNNKCFYIRWHNGKRPLSNGCETTEYVLRTWGTSKER